MYQMWCNKVPNRCLKMGNRKTNSTFLPFFSAYGGNLRFYRKRTTLFHHSVLKSKKKCNLGSTLLFAVETNCATARPHIFFVNIFQSLAHFDNYHKTRYLPTYLLTLYILFDESSTSIRLQIAFIFGVQTL